MNTLKLSTARLNGTIFWMILSVCIRLIILMDRGMIDVLVNTDFPRPQ